MCEFDYEIYADVDSNGKLKLVAYFESRGDAIHAAHAMSKVYGITTVSHHPSGQPSFETVMRFEDGREMAERDELLAALKDAACAMESDLGGNHRRGAIDAAVAAIAKAEGTPA